jgi:ribosome-associated protein
MAKTEKKPRPASRKKPLDSARGGAEAKPFDTAGGPPLDDARGKLPADITKAVKAALDKKATDVVVLDLRHTPAFTDFFVLCSGQNTRQVQAIADAIEDALRAAKVRPSHVEGYARAEWILMDFFTFIVHVFAPHTREFYSLERLWGDARQIRIEE